MAVAGRSIKEQAKTGRLVVTVLKYLTLIVGCLVVFVPIVVILLGAFKDGKEFANTGVFELPKSWRLLPFCTNL